MGHTNIIWPNQPSTIAAAILATAMVGVAPDVMGNFVGELGRVDTKWNAPNASQVSSHGIVVSYGKTSSTSAAFGATTPEAASWQELESLEADWDGNDAERVSQDAIEHAIRFVESLQPIGPSFEPFAHPNGSVGLESKKSGKSAYLIVSPVNRFAYVIRVGDAVHRGDDVNSLAVRKILALLY